MSRFRFRHVQNSCLIFLLSSIILLTGTLGIFFTPPITLAQVGPEIAVDPASNEANPTESFTVDVNITDAEDLFSYEMKLGYNPSILSVASILEGPFIKDQTTAPSGTYWSSNIQTNYLYASCVTLGAYPGVSGSGTLFNVTFNVLDGGTSSLNLYDSLLLNSTGAEISHSVVDGMFATSVPAASFTFSPQTYGRPTVGETVTFNASTSYDPNGMITNYAWDFGDETSSSGASPVATHVYDTATNSTTFYTVTLTVTDDDAETDNSTQEVDVKYHDLVVLGIDAPEEIFLHQMAEIDVTVLNNGSHRDSFNVTAYYDATPVDVATITEVVPGTTETLTLLWVTYINQTTLSPNATLLGTWTDPLNASRLDGNYTLSNTTQSIQEYKGYVTDTTGWTGISKVEVGIAAKTDDGGDDQLSIQAQLISKTPGDEQTYNITNTTDSFFWVDVTGSDPSYWVPYKISANEIKIKLKYLQVGSTATPIYVDWLPVRITPQNPTEVPAGTYTISANASLVDGETLESRPGEEADPSDNTLVGDPLVIAIAPVHDVAVTTVEVGPTDLTIGQAAQVSVTVENQGNVGETFDLLIYANSTVIGNQTGLTLTARATQDVTVTWFRAADDTLEGTYNITVYTPQVHVNETDTTDNRNESTVQIRLLPVAAFAITPAFPKAGDEITFNASLSYAPGVPGGEIVDYAWDLGDGNVATGMIVTHTYSTPGWYWIELTVFDDEGLNSSQTERVRFDLKVVNSTLTISASPPTVPLGLNTTISGSLEPIRADAAVTINYTTADDGAWTTLATVSTTEDGEYSFIWTPLQEGTYLIKAYWEGDIQTNPANSSTLQVTVKLVDVAVDEVALSTTTLAKGESLTINVTVTNQGTAPETFDVNVYYNTTLLDTRTISNQAAGATETISFNWNTQNADEGTYTIKAEVEPLLGETDVTDNSRTRDVTVEAAAPPVDYTLYAIVGAAIAGVIVIAYLVLRTRSKPKP